MKAKKLVLGLAAVLAFSSLAACTDNDKSIPFSDYWKLDSLTADKVDETLVYKVAYEKGTGVDTLGYTLTYGEGTYTTHLKTHEDGYLYTTALTMPVSYEYAGEKTEVMTDSVTTEVRFKGSNFSLRPISSTKTVVSHSPSSSATSLNSCYTEYNYTVTTKYEENYTATSSVVYQKTKDSEAHTAPTSTFEYAKGKYSYLDNELLLIALRAISSDSTNCSAKVYNPFLNIQQKVDFSFAEGTSAKFTYKQNEIESTKDVAYRPISITIDSKTPGATQTAWIATTTNAHNNTNRNRLLRLETPLSYSIGTLVYTLTSVVDA